MDIEEDDTNLLQQELEEMLAQVEASIDALMSSEEYDIDKSQMMQCLETVRLYLLDQVADLEQ